MRVVICGGGVIGACTAYFLSRRGIDVIVVERTEVAAAASGKAGGFLALDWCAGSPLDALARRSFGLHAALRGEIDGDWGYQRTTAYGGFVVPERDARRHVPSELDWLSDGVRIAQRLGTTETTAMLHPRKFTAAVMSAAQQHGAELRHGRVTGLVRRGGIDRDRSRDRRRRHRGGCGRGRARALVAARRRMDGPAARVRTAKPEPRLRPRQRCPGGCALPRISGTSGDVLTVEVFPRADGSTHVVAFGDDAPLPLDPAAVTPEPDEIDRLRAICERLSPLFRPRRSLRGRPASVR